MPGDHPVLYEMMYIVDPSTGEDDIEKAVESVAAEITNLGGAIEKESRWGQRRLAYPIKKRSEGFYVVLDYKLQPSKHRDLLAFMRITKEILRFLSLRVPKAKLLQEKHEARMMKKRAAAAQARAEQEAEAEAIKAAAAAATAAATATDTETAPKAVEESVAPVPAEPTTPAPEEPVVAPEVESVVVSEAEAATPSTADETVQEETPSAAPVATEAAVPPVEPAPEPESEPEPAAESSDEESESEKSV